ncbi:MAG: phytanoyl-CoA dioxygenase family protein [Rhodospirillales bacterium]|nr:phytanoyl-CoA dioxygenase family protein [Rhodospirillales bacterium]
MPKSLTEQQIEQYGRDGYVSPVAILTADETAEIRREIEAVEASMDGSLSGTPRTKFYLRFPWAHRLATHGAILDAVEDLIGPDIMLYHNIAWLKNPGDDSYVSWHQDNTYFGHTPCDVLTVWMALSPATAESGCMRILPGTHKLGQLPLATPDTGGGNMLSSGQTVDFDISSIAPVSMALAPGEASIHHALAIHGSPPNQGDDRRLGITFIYHPPGLRQLGEGRTSALLVRGEDRFGHLEAEQPPLAKDSPETIARHERAVGLYRDKVRELGNMTVTRFD